MASVLSVGSMCDMTIRNRRALVREVTGAFLERAWVGEEDGEAMIAEKRYDLILVNRVFDSGGEGLPFIEQLKKAGRATVMLVSDYASAQARRWRAAR